MVHDSIGPVLEEASDDERFPRRAPAGPSMPTPADLAAYTSALQAKDRRDYRSTQKMVCCHDACHIFVVYSM